MKASKYDALQNSNVKAKKLKNKPKVVRSGKGGAKKADKDRSKRIASMKRLKESGHVNDSVSLLEGFCRHLTKEVICYGSSRKYPIDLWWRTGTRRP